ncbi:ASCH domain-containing protein [Methylobacterium sp. CCH5-D2]|uniref:ASCH domain-containing protein n=1 Tax=Methylobacterium sp. CCH5-D2 TaxID=1768765 RepID=UPI00082FB90E|nr:ASCH domain-containing protein [Methylobacterium sp. CCH5-D2]
MSAIPAITIWEPWASLIIAGAKPYEFRGWAAPRAYHGTRIAIHAGARPVRKAEVADLIVRLRGPQAWTTCLRPEIALPMLDRLHANPKAAVLSHVLGTAVLGLPIRAHEIVGEFGGILNDSDRAEHCNFAWPLTDIRPCIPPVPARGAQGFWPWGAEEAA